MYFNMKRYYFGVVKRRFLFILLLFVPGLFLIVSASMPDRFQVKQVINIADNSPVALMSNPVGYRAFKELKKAPSAFFMNPYTLNKLTGAVLSGWSDRYGSMITESIRTCMSMSDAGEDKIQIIYYGTNREIGEILVGYYSERLIKKAIEGQVRSNNGAPGFKPALFGGIEIEELRALWRSDRLYPLIYSVLISIVLVFLLFGVLEWNDQSFKSERQIARYIGLPILGTVPDLNKVATLMQKEESTSI